MWQALEKWDARLMCPGTAGWSAALDAEAQNDLNVHLLDVQRQADTHWLWELTRRATAVDANSASAMCDAETIDYMTATLTDRLLLGYTEPQWMRLVSVLGMLVQRVTRDRAAALYATVHYVMRVAFVRSSGAGLMPWRPPAPDLVSFLSPPAAPGASFGHPLRILFGDLRTAHVPPPTPRDILAAPSWATGLTAAQFHRQTMTTATVPPWDRTLTPAVYESIVAILARTLKQQKRYTLVPPLFFFSAVAHHRTAFAVLSNTLFHAGFEVGGAGRKDQLQQYAHQVRTLVRDLTVDAVQYVVHPANTAFLFDHFFVSYLGARTRALFVDIAKCTALIYRSQLEYVAPHLAHAPHEDPVTPWYTRDLVPDFCRSNLGGTNTIVDTMRPLLGPGGREEGAGSLSAFTPAQQARAGAPRRRIGYISAFYHDLHSVYRDRQGIIRGAPHEDWEVFVFAVQAPSQPCVQRMFQSADHVVILSGNLAEAQAQIAQARLDALVYCDIGMYPLTYYLAFARLAAVQINTWGHSDTSGIPAMDYFLSSRWFAGPGGPDGSNPQLEFSEQLVLLDSLTTFYQPLYDSAAHHLPRSEFRPFFRRGRASAHTALTGGLPVDGPLLVCMQSLFKFSDVFLDVLVRCLRRCPTAYVLVLRDGDPSASAEQATFEERLDRTLGGPDGEDTCDVLGRVLMLDRLPMVAYQSLLLYADLFLDPYPFGGCNSSLESFQHGQVVVTWPHPVRLSGRFTVGLYRRMGLADTDNRALVSGADEYVDTVERLLGDHEELEVLRAQIRQRRHVLFAEQGSVDEWYAVVDGLIGRAPRPKIEKGP